MPSKHMRQRCKMEGSPCINQQQYKGQTGKSLLLLRFTCTETLSCDLSVVHSRCVAQYCMYRHVVKQLISTSVQVCCTASLWASARPEQLLTSSRVLSALCLSLLLLLLYSIAASHSDPPLRCLACRVCLANYCCRPASMHPFTHSKCVLDRLSRPS